MSIEGKCKPRFKGIENFLRRVAFNLGNSPSQTEVKIISCIPIDVSDLQQKITDLERKAEILKNRQFVGSRDRLEQKCVGNINRQEQRPVVNTALYTSQQALSHSHHRPPSATPNPAPHHDYPSGHAPFRPNKQSISFFYPALPKCTGVPPPCTSLQSPPKINVESYPCINAPNTGEVENQPAFFKFQKSRSLKGNDKVNTHLVYYAQTSSASPFNRKKTAEMIKKAPKDSMDRPYLAEMVRKQYRPDKMVVEMSDTSQFSSPVCRDVQYGEYSPNPYEADMCSCCRGRFQDVDLPRHAQTVFQTNPTTTNDYSTNSMYYDTSLYDMVPVRERPMKQKNDKECPKKKEHKTSSNYIEKVRAKSRFQPYVVNYHNAAPARMNHKLARRKLLVKSYGKNDKRNASKRQLTPPTSTATSNSCSVKCGQVYSKTPRAKPVIQRVINPPAKAVLYKNAECLTISLHNTECQTASTKSVQLEPIVPDEDKTEMTLNQIKTILQSVLTEVKTSSQLKNVADAKPKKDAIVQKGPSQGNIQARSSLLHSYSTPYSMNPYAASCSRQLNPSQTPFYPGSPYMMKCLQNYPLFIQTTGRQCACCYRNIPNVAKSAHTKHAITTATNTESTAVQEHRNKETEKLIKEIYKSLAINMDFPAKDTSSSDYENLRSTDNSKRFEQGTPRPQRMDLAVDCVVKKMQNTSTTPIYTNTTFERAREIISNAASTPSPLASKTTSENRTRAERMEGYVESQSRQSAYSSRVRSGARRGAYSEVGRSGAGRGQRAPYVLQQPNATTSIGYGSSSSETDSDETVVPVDQPKKEGRTSIFRKVAKLFKSRPKKKDKEPDSDSEHDSEASDSDDYQTIDTRSEKRPKQVIYIDKRRPKVKPHSKHSYSKYMNRDKNEKRRSPYMEQEYRRHFDEKLMFHYGARGHQYSSDLPLSNQSAQPQRAYPVYWQNYDTRNVHIDPRRNLTNPVQDMAVGPANMIQPKATASNKGLAWLKKHKLGIHCGDQWKKLILDG